MRENFNFTGSSEDGDGGGGNGGSGKASGDGDADGGEKWHFSFGSPWKDDVRRIERMLGKNMSIT